jgi:prevent-host-death family protein
MSTTLSVVEAKERLECLVSRAEAGETIIVTRDGRPVATLGPLPQPRPIKYGYLRGTYVADDLSLPDEILDSFEPEP